MKSEKMNIKVYCVGESDYDNENAEIRRIEILVDGNKYRFTYDRVYGLVLNKINQDDKGTDCISIMPRSTNEIQIK